MSSTSFVLQCRYIMLTAAAGAFPATLEWRRRCGAVRFLLFYMFLGFK